MYTTLWNSHLVMCPLCDIHTWSCIPIMLFSLGHEYLCGYSPLVMYPHVDIHIWACIPVWIFTFGHVSVLLFLLDHVPHDDIDAFSRMHMLIFILDHDILTWSYVLIWKFRPSHGSPCWYCHSIVCTFVDICTGSCITSLLVSLGHVILCW